MGSLFTTCIVNPLYNALVVITNILPTHDIGIAVIVLTVLVKILLMPLATSSSKTQHVMRRIADTVKDIQARHKDDKLAQAQATMALYREHGVRPLSSLLIMLVQLPIILGLYWVFFKGGFPTIDPGRLYSFITPAFETFNMQFLGLIDMGARSALLAFLAGASQFAYARMLPGPAIADGEEGFKAEFQKSMQLQIKWVLPVVVAVIAYTISAAIALYWLVSNLVGIVQEWYFGRRYKKFTSSQEEQDSSYA